MMRSLGNRWAGDYQRQLKGQLLKLAGKFFFHSKNKLGEDTFHTKSPDKILRTSFPETIRADRARLKIEDLATLPSFKKAVVRAYAQAFPFIAVSNIPKKLRFAGVRACFEYLRGMPRTPVYKEILSLDAKTHPTSGLEWIREELKGEYNPRLISARFVLGASVELKDMVRRRVYKQDGQLKVIAEPTGASPEAVVHVGGCFDTFKPDDGAHVAVIGQAHAKAEWKEDGCLHIVMNALDKVLTGYTAIERRIGSRFLRMDGFKYFHTRGFKSLVEGKPLQLLREGVFAEAQPV